MHPRITLENQQYEEEKKTKKKEPWAGVTAAPGHQPVPMIAICHVTL